MIYFDNSATTVPYPEALRTYQEVATKIFGNPSSLHQLGTSATRILEASRKQVAELIGKSADEIFFTSGGTEGDNWVIKGVAFEKEPYGKHIIVSDIEHPAVKESAKWLSEHGFEVSYAPVNEQGFVDVEALAGLLRPDTILVSVMAVNNEIGSIQPIQAISDLLANEPTISFHVDAVQAIGKIPVSSYLTDRVDFATFSGHKFHAVRGVGFVYKKAGKKIIFDELAKYEDITIFSGEGEDFAPNILTFGIKGVRGEVIVHAFEEHQIYISTTSACSSKAGKPAGPLISMGVPTKLAQTAVRISLDDDNDMGQVEQFLTIFKQVYAKTQKVR